MMFEKRIHGRKVQRVQKVLKNLVQKVQKSYFFYKTWSDYNESKLRKTKLI